MLPEVPLVKSLCLSECLEGLSCLGHCRTVTWSTVTPLTMFFEMQFSLEFLDVGGSLERLKRNSVSVVLRPTLIDAFSFIFELYFQIVFRSPVNWKVKCHEGRALPGSARNTEGTRLIRRGLGKEGMLIPTSPCALWSIPFLINPSWVCQAAGANSRGERAVSSEIKLLCWDSVYW